MSVTIAAACDDFISKSFLKRLILASSLLLVLAGLARAQSYPEFDGVYFKMNDGSFVELAEVGKVQPLGRAFLPSENWLNQPEGLWQVDQFSNAPVIDPESAQSLVIVGRGFRDLRWTPFNSFNERYKGFIPDPQLPTKFDDYTKNIRESTDVNRLLGGNYIYRGNCGLDETSVKVRRVSDFVTELLPDGYRWPSAQNFSTGGLRDRGCNWQPIPAQVVEIVVDGKFYAFKPKAGLNMSGPSNSKADVRTEDMEQTLLRVGGLFGKAEVFNVQMLYTSIVLYPDGTGYFNLMGSSGEICQGTLHAKSKAPKEMSFDVSAELPEHEKCAGVAEIVLYQSQERKEVFMADFWSRKPGQTDVTLSATGLLSYVNDENPITSEINTYLSDLSSPLALDSNEFPVLGMGD